jgi:hypothetical protein
MYDEHYQENLVVVVNKTIASMKHYGMPQNVIDTFQEDIMGLKNFTGLIEFPKDDPMQSTDEFRYEQHAHAALVYGDMFPYIELCLIQTEQTWFVRASYAIIQEIRSRFSNYDEIFENVPADTRISMVVTIANIIMQAQFENEQRILNERIADVTK